MTEQEAIEDIEKNILPSVGGISLRMAIGSLEKQIPKVPCYSGDGYYGGELIIDTWECPCCGKEYEIDYDDYKYCPNCGQHIDHSTLTEDD